MKTIQHNLAQELTGMRRSKKPGGGWIQVSKAIAGPNENGFRSGFDHQTKAMVAGGDRGVAIHLRGIG